MKSILLSMVLTVTFTQSLWAGGRTPNNDPKLGYGLKFISDQESEGITEKVIDLHKLYNIKPTQFALANFDLPTGERYDVDGDDHMTRYRSFTFIRYPNSDRMIIRYYRPTGKLNESQYRKLPDAYKDWVNSLFSKLELKLYLTPYRHGLLRDGRAVYGELKRAKNAKRYFSEFTLFCNDTRYSDGSGGERCYLRVDKINLKDFNLELQYATTTEKIEKLPWTKKAFKVSEEAMDLHIQIARDN